LCVQWKDGSTSWERLADLKESYPIEVAEFAVSRGLDQQPAFAWWVSAVLHKRNLIIAAVNKRYVKKDFMFGIWQKCYVHVERLTDWRLARRS